MWSTWEAAFPAGHSASGNMDSDFRSHPSQPISGINKRSTLFQENFNASLPTSAADSIQHLQETAPSWSHPGSPWHCCLWALVPTQPGAWFLRLSSFLVTCCTEWNHKHLAAPLGVPEPEGPSAATQVFIHLAKTFTLHLVRARHCGAPKQGG